MKQDLTQFGKKVREWEKRYPNAVYTGVKEASEVVKKAAQRNVSGRFTARSGEMERSIAAIVSKKPVGGVIRINKKAQYPKGIHERGGTITAKRKPWLVFQINGQWVKRKTVTIPARPFLGPALESNRKQVAKIIGRVIRRAVFDVRK